MSSGRVVETINECLSLADSDSPESVEKALQTLASLTRVSPQNRAILAETQGAIPKLASLINASWTSPIIQTLSLLVLFNLSLNPHLKLTLADMETIKLLNSRILFPTSPDSSKLASSLICSLAMLDKNKAKLGVAGTVEAVVRALSTSHDSLSHHLVSCLAELVHFHGNCTLAVRAGVVPVLLHVAQTTDGEDLAATSLAVVSLLARFHEGLSALKNTKNVMKGMLNVLRRRSLASKEGALEILVRLFDESEECVKEAVMMPEFALVLPDVSVRGSVSVRDKADLLMNKMAQSVDEGTTIFG